MKGFLVGLLFLLSGCSYAAGNDTELKLDMDGKGSCSATVVKPNVVLTATHCFSKPGASKASYVVDNLLIPLDIDYMLDDGSDHTLIVLKSNQFTKVRKVDFDFDFKKGQAIHWVGNPFIFEKQLRYGYVTGFFYDKKDWVLFDGNSYQGDSGSCLIYKDKCVAVLSGMYSSPDGMFKLTAAMMFTFDPQDLKVLGL